MFPLGQQTAGSLTQPSRRYNRRAQTGIGQMPAQRAPQKRASLGLDSTGMGLQTGGLDRTQSLGGQLDSTGMGLQTGQYGGITPNSSGQRPVGIGGVNPPPLVQPPGGGGPVVPMGIPGGGINPPANQLPQQSFAALGQLDSTGMGLQTGGLDRTQSTDGYQDAQLFQANQQDSTEMGLKAGSGEQGLDRTQSGQLDNTEMGLQTGGLDRTQSVDGGLDRTQSTGQYGYQGLDRTQRSGANLDRTQLIGGDQRMGRTQRRGGDQRLDRTQSTGGFYEGLDRTQSAGDDQRPLPTDVAGFQSWAKGRYGREATPEQLQQIARQVGYSGQGPISEKQMQQAQKISDEMAKALGWKQPAETPTKKTTTDGGLPVRKPIDLSVDDAPDLDLPDLELPENYDDPNYQGGPDFQRARLRKGDRYNAPSLDQPDDYRDADLNVPGAYRANRLNLGQEYGGAGEYRPSRYNQRERFKAPSFEEAQNDPGYQFALKQEIGSIAAQKAREGLLRTTGTMDRLEEAKQGMAAKQYQDVYNRRAGEYDRAYGNELGIEDRNYAREGDIYDRGRQDKLDVDDRRYRDRTTQYNADREGGLDEYNLGTERGRYGAERTDRLNEGRYNRGRQSGLDRYGAEREGRMDEYSTGRQDRQDEYQAEREGGLDEYDRRENRSRYGYETGRENRESRYNRGVDSGSRQYDARFQNKTTSYAPKFATWQARTDSDQRGRELNFDREYQRDLYNADDRYRRGRDETGDRYRDRAYEEDVRRYNIGDVWRGREFDEGRRRYLSDLGLRAS